MASVYYTSGSVKSNSGFIISIDGYGDEKSVSVFRFEKKSNPREVLSLPFGAAPGMLYKNTTKALGMKPNRHEGKVTGLSARGNPEILYEKTKKYLFFDKKRKNFVDDHIKKSLINRIFLRAFDFAFNDILRLNISKIKRPNFYKLLKEEFSGFSKEDIAAAVQKRFEDEIMKFLKFVVKNENPGAFLLAGGIFANVKLNGIIAETYKESEIYVHPGMTDEGIALGAALYGNYKVFKANDRKIFKDVYLGSNYDSNIELFVDSLPDKYVVSKFSPENKNDINKIAQLISEDKVIGLFSGSMEYGPRALGNRTILADPRNNDINDILNARLKRTEYMPFAPVVPAKFADVFFDFSNKRIKYTSNFMTIVTDTNKEVREKVPAIVHVDNSARPQIIERETNPLYYDIIIEYGKITGINCLINTSFNLHEEPIVESPEDAIKWLSQE